MKLNIHQLSSILLLLCCMTMLIAQSEANRKLMPWRPINPGPGLPIRFDPPKRCWSPISPQCQWEIELLFYFGQSMKHSVECCKEVRDLPDGCIEKIFYRKFISKDKSIHNIKVKCGLVGRSTLSLVAALAPAPSKET